MSVRACLLPGIVGLISVAMLSACGGAKSALSLLEKQKYPQAKETLHKALAEDSLPVGARYVSSLLYTDSSFVGYHIDTGYQFIQRAIAEYAQADEKQQEKLFRQLSLDSLLLQQQKQRVDSLAYARATQDSSIRAYQRFINGFASAYQLPQAVSYRNQLIFDSVQRVDTYPAYKFFMDAYPEAKQYALAQQRYNTLAFQELTQAGNLGSYLTFLRNYPNSPYRPQAEQAVFEISTADSQLESYAAFARQYPQSASARQAVNLLYHLYTSGYDAADFLQDFPDLPYTDSLRQVIRTEKRTLAPVLTANRYGFIDSQGNAAINAYYDYLPTTYLCQGVLSNFVHAAVLDSGQLRHELLTKGGQTVFSFTEPYDSSEVYLEETVEELGAGLLKVNRAGQLTVYHKAGYPIVTALDQAEEVALIASDEQHRGTWSVPYQFIKFSVAGQWGIKAFSGRTLLAPAYTSIEEYGPFVVLERDGQLGVTTRRALVELTEKPEPTTFPYDDVALLEGQFLLVYQEEQEAVLDQQLNTVVPLDDHRVVRRFGSSLSRTGRWLLKRAETVQSETVQQATPLSDSALVSRDTSAVVSATSDTLTTGEHQSFYYLYPPKSTTRGIVSYRKAFYNNQWLTLKAQRKFSLMNYQRTDSSQASGVSTENYTAEDTALWNSAQVYDSVQILGEHFVLTFQALGTGQDSVTVLMDQERRRTFPLQTGADGKTNPSFRLLRTKGIMMSDQLQEYLLVDPTYDRQLVLNPQGKVVVEQSLADAVVYPSGLLVIQEGRYQGLVDSTGQELLPARYDGIGNYEAGGTLSLFKGKKFGLYQYPSGATIEPTYESALTVYHPADSASRTLFVAKEDGKYGVVTSRNEPRTPFAFDRIIYWNDTSALVKADEQWMIYRLDSLSSRGRKLTEEDILYQSIDDFSFFGEGTSSSQNEQLLRIYANKSYGVLSSQRGELLSPTYDGVSLFGNASPDTTSDDYLFLTEKYVPEAELYIMIYRDAAGKLVRRLALTPEQYDRMYCQ